MQIKAMRRNLKLATALVLIVSAPFATTNLMPLRAWAAAQSSEVDALSCDSGCLIAMSSQSHESLGKCALKHTAVKANVAGFVTRVTVKQQFHNPYNSTIEALYTFPLPENAAVDQMVMRIGNRTISGTIKKRAEARQIYHSALRAGHAASLLDQERPNIFTQSVANIEPGENIDVEISYVDLLRYENGEFSFTFPTVVGPRFIPHSNDSHDVINKVSDAARITPPMATRSGHDISIAMTINGGVPISNIHAPLHDIDVRTDGLTKAQVTLKNKGELPNRDFVVQWNAAAEKVQSGYLTSRKDNDGFFTLLFTPPKRVEVKDVCPKEMVFLLDCSGSQAGLPLKKAKEAINYILDHMGENDTFRILAFSDKVTEFSAEPENSTATSRIAAHRFLESINAVGGTWAGPAVERVCSLSKPDNHLRIVVFMTDGFFGNDKEIVWLIQKLRSKTRWFPFGTGNEVNRFLIDAIATEGGGEPDYVLLNSSAEAVGKKFYERISTPVLTDIKLAFEGLKVSEIYPQGLADLWAQRPLVMTGKYTQPGKGKAVLTGYSAGKPYRQEMDVDFPAENNDNDALQSIWARAKVNELTRKSRIFTKGDDALKTQVENTALKYHIMSPFTSFVAVDETKGVKEKSSTSVVVPVESPDGLDMDTGADYSFAYRHVNFRSGFRSFPKEGTGFNNAAQDPGTISIGAGVGQVAMHAYNLAKGNSIPHLATSRPNRAKSDSQNAQTETTQSIQLERDEASKIVCEMGTEYQQKDRRISLKKGSLLISVQKKPIKLSTQFGDISLPEQSVIISSAGPDLVRIANLYSPNTLILEMYTNGKKRRIEIRTGNELVIKPSAVSNEPTISPAEFHRKILSKENVENLTLLVNEFNSSEMAQSEHLFQSHFLDEGTKQRIMRQIDRAAHKIPRSS
jgi:Ca-activated chloride channel family protein